MNIMKFFIRVRAHIIKYIACVFALTLFVFPQIASAEGDQYLDGKIQQVNTETGVITVVLQNDGAVVEIENNEIGISGLDFQKGDKVVVTQSEDLGGRPFYYITDFKRSSTLVWLFVLFVVLTTLVGRKKGFASLCGMVFSFFILFWFVIPRIMVGGNPIVFSILGAFIIIPVIFLLSHGVNKKTTSAMIGTIIALIITGVLAHVSIHFSKLTGLATEEAAMLGGLGISIENIKGLLLGGIIIGLLGILDDVTVTQASLVYKLKETNPNLSKVALFGKAIDVGRDHIASVVNTLVLVYAGAAMPLLLLFVDSSLSYEQAINFEIVAEEIVRTLVATIGLILAVPITTYIVCYRIGSEKGK